MLRKAVFLVRNYLGRDFADWHRQVMNRAVPQLLEINPERLKVGLTRTKAPRFTVLPLETYPLAMFSIWTNSDDEWQRYFTALSCLQGKIEAYTVEESVPVAYQKDWADGAESPGVVLLTLLRRNRQLDYAEFMREWHGRHTPMAMRIHPMWQYIRNVVREPLTPGAPDFQGIVEEHYRPRADCLNPIRMFGGGFKALPAMLEVYRHANHFLDLAQTQNFLLNEIHIKS